MAIPQIRQTLNTIRDYLKGIQTLLTKLENEKKEQAQEKKLVDELDSVMENEELKAKSADSALSSGTESKFHDTLREFYESSFSAYENIMEKFKATEKSFEAVVLYYGEDPKTTTSEEFFGIFVKFCSSFTNARLENDAAALKVIEAKKKEAQQKVFRINYVFFI